MIANRYGVGAWPLAQRSYASFKDIVSVSSVSVIAAKMQGEIFHGNKRFELTSLY